MHHAASWGDLVSMAAKFSQRMGRHGAENMPARMPAFISDGRWVTNCPRDGCHNGPAADRATARAVCFDCGAVFSVEFPPEMGDVEDVLMDRPSEFNRHWTPGESPVSLAIENIVRGLPAPKRLVDRIDDGIVSALRAGGRA